jgi:DNA segregation ATPase FtsK/SpoIIIE-like protein
MTRAVKLSEEAKYALFFLLNKTVLSGCTSYVQRKLQTSYNAAAALMQELEDTGYITEADRTGMRRITDAGRLALRDAGK